MSAVGAAAGAAVLLTVTGVCAALGRAADATPPMQDEPDSDGGGDGT